MATFRPFPALRPDPSLAARICELPYDVVSSVEARAIAAGNPLSFFHVSKPEIDLPPGVGPYDERVYAKGQENFRKLIGQGALRQDAEPHFYLYRQTMGQHTQLGLVGVASCEDYLHGTIRKHELTRVEKEDDRVRHVEHLNAQTGPAFLIYPADQPLDECLKDHTATTPEIDFVAADQVRHSAWTIRDAASERLIQSRLASFPAVYIADGHHRSAAAARVYQHRCGAGQSGYFLSVLFPTDQVQILPYHRVLKDLNGATPHELLDRLATIFTITRADHRAEPARAHELGLYVEQAWFTLRFRPDLITAKGAVERLDVTLLQKHVLAPVFDVHDPRTSARISFVGGIRGTAELERLVDSGEYACAFSMFPTAVEDLLAVAAAGDIMPPKSTWFEPKLRDGMFCHLLE